MLVMLPGGLLVFCALLLAAPAGASASDGAGSTAAAAGGAHTPGASAALVHYDPDSGNLEVKAEQSEVGSLFRTVAEQAGVGVEVGTGVSGKVSVAFSGLSLEEGIRRIVEAAGIGNLAAEYSRIPGKQGPAAYRIEKFSVLGKGAAVQPVVRQASSPGGSARTGGGDSPVPAQREKGNPSTGFKERNRTARFNPKHSGAGAGVPVQQFPGPVRDLGARRLEGSGEEKQLHSLMRSAQRGDARAIGLLGQIGDRQAAPVLARIVTRSPEGSPPRKAAAAALRQLAVTRSTP